jgi:hypothetical protein
MRNKYNTNWPVFLVLFAVIFMAFSLISFPGKGDNSIVAKLGDLLSGDYINGTFDMMVSLLVMLIVTAIPSLALAWVLQAVMVVLVARYQRYQSGRTRR